MTEYELVSAFFEGLVVLDGNFEFWLTVTLAMLVTFRFARPRIPKGLWLLLVGLYLAGSVLFAVKLFTSGVTVTTIRNQIALLETETYIIDQLLNFLVGILFLAVVDRWHDWNARLHRKVLNASRELKTTVIPTNGWSGRVVVTPLSCARAAPSRHAPRRRCQLAWE